VLEEREAAEQERQRVAAAAAAVAEAKAAAGAIPWTVKDGINEYDKDEEDALVDEEDLDNAVELYGRKPADAHEETKDCTQWDLLEAYLRGHFDIHSSNKKVALRLKLVVCTSSGYGEEPAEQVLFNGRARDQSTLSFFWYKLEESVKTATVQPLSRRVEGELYVPATPKNIKRVRKPATARAKAEAAIFDELKTAIYGAGAGQHAEGEWTEKASEVFRKNPKWAKKFLVMRKLTDMVMGDPNILCCKILAQPLRHPLPL